MIPFLLFYSIAFTPVTPHKYQPKIKQKAVGREPLSALLDGGERKFSPFLYNNIGTTPLL
jgi:hypothetical protein